MRLRRTLVIVACSCVLLFVAYELCYSGMPKQLPRSAAHLITTANTVTLLSLYPDDLDENLPPDVLALPRFHGYPVLGQVVATPDERRAILEAVTSGVARNYGDAAACFEPRHGLVIANGLRSGDFVICFQCWQMEIHESFLPHTWAYTSREPEVVLSAILRAHHVVIPPSARK